MARKKQSKSRINYNSNTEYTTNPRYTWDVWHTKSTLLPIKDLESFRRSLAKVANNRLRALEKNNMDYYAYDVAADYLRTQGKKGKMRFQESKKPMDQLATRREIQLLQNFLSMPSSTVAGQKRIEAKRIETFGNWKPKGAKGKNIKGIDLSKQAGTKIFYEFLNSKAFENLRKFYSSEQIFRAYKDGNVGGSKSQKKIQDAMMDYVKNERKPSVKGLYEAVGASVIPNSANK
jgi:hypothetical protein